MSLLDELQSMKGAPSGFPKFSKEGGADSKQLGDVEAMLMATPIPGQSLTQSPENRLPYEKPPKFTDLQEFIDETFLRFTDEEALGDLLESMRLGLPVEHIAEKYLERTFQNGDVSPDLMLLAIEPVIYMLIALATYAEIDPVLYPEDPMIDEEVSPMHTDLYKRAVKEMQKEPEPKGNDGKVTINDFQVPTNVPQSLLQRSKLAVTKIKGE